MKEDLRSGKTAALWPWRCYLYAHFTRRSAAIRSSCTAPLSALPHGEQNKGNTVRNGIITTRWKRCAWPASSDGERADERRVMFRLIEMDFGGWIR